MACLRLAHLRNALVEVDTFEGGVPLSNPRLRQPSALILSVSNVQTTHGNYKKKSVTTTCLVGRNGTRHPWKFQCSSKPYLEPQQDVEVLQARTMEEIYDILAKRLLLSAMSIADSSKYVVGMAGPPGAGKSTVAKAVVERLNALWIQSSSFTDLERNNVKDHSKDIAIALPMDGFHLYRKQLDMMKDPVEAHARRGAPWTFDPDGLIKCLQLLRAQGWVQAPSFDHGVGDPKENDIIVTYSHRIVLVEGNYLLLADEKWRALENIFDERW
ncbi:hypothetical protein KP509_22G049500 [Ceratopteris richardii]|nr:hypothetical protein KP509_22G049500 [Ceratopteris richardii]